MIKEDVPTHTSVDRIYQNDVQSAQLKHLSTKVRCSRLTNPMIKHLAQRPSHTRPPRLFPIDSVHGLVQEQTDPPSVAGRCVDDGSDVGIDSRSC